MSTSVPAQQQSGPDKSKNSAAVINVASAKGTHRTMAELLLLDPDCRRVLDIPCGEGAFSRHLLNLGKEVFGTDIQDICKLEGVNFRVGDMNERLPFADGELDAVVNIDGIEHIERPYDFVRECNRITRDGGWLIISTPNISALRSRWRFFLTGFHNKAKKPLDETQPSPMHHIGMLGLPQLRYMLHTKGYRITDITTNRSKALSFLYLPLVPILWLLTSFVFWREIKTDSRRRVAKDVKRQMFSTPILFGETMCVRAQKLPAAN
ncbi:MAG: class I SAM-dependent methyltransferase [Planctomycetota bacterium]|jgi:2-polyprenyl-3-methyl-5-hydroxy-6-metoxy-1,4-benzoquinol methylase